MPSHAELQRQANAVPNQFEDALPRVTEFTAQEIATLQSRLEKQLGPEYISTRPGAGGGKVHYLAAEKVINLANEVFGFNGWSSSIQNVHVDFLSEKEGKISLSCSIICRVTLKDGTYHEDVGCGSIDNCRSKAQAFEKAKKEAATDALKRALRNFGNVLGNCLYDKDYLSKVSKVKFAPAKWDADNLHRHPHFAVKKESIAEICSAEPDTKPEANDVQAIARLQSATSAGTDYEDEFGGNLFEGVDFTRPDEVILDDISGKDNAETPDLPASIRPEDAMQGLQQKQALSRVQSLPLVRSNEATIHQPPPPRHPAQQSSPPMQPGRLQPARAGRMTQPATEVDQYQRGNPALAQSNGPSHPQPRMILGAADSSMQGLKEGLAPLDGGQPHPAMAVGFIPGRAAELLQQNSTGGGARNLPAFNPHADSPSIRRTTGIEHGATRPIKKEDIVKLRAAAHHGSPCTSGPHLETGASKVGAGLAGPPGRPGYHAGAAQNFINPQTDANRRIGMPGTAQSPLANRATYKPPLPGAGLKRGVDGVPQQHPNRLPLTDVSNINNPPKVNAFSNSASDGIDAKRQRVEGT